MATAAAEEGRELVRTVLPHVTNGADGVPVVANYVGGAWVGSAATMPNEAPALGEVVALIPRGCAAEVNAAEAAATAAQRKLPPNAHLRPPRRRPRCGRCGAVGSCPGRCP